MKRSLEIILTFQDRPEATLVLERAGIEVAEARSNFIQVRKTTPTEIRRLLKDLEVKSIQDGFRR